MDAKIKQLANDLAKAEHWDLDEESALFVLDRQKTATHLCKMGYSKQIVGEWMHPLKDEPWKPKMFGRCSECNYTENGHTKKMPKFCSNCGAKMKGGAE